MLFNESIMITMLLVVSKLYSHKETHTLMLLLYINSLNFTFITL